MADSPQLARLNVRFNAIPKAVRDAIKPELERRAQELVAEMQHLAPVDTGALRDSIVWTPPGETTPPYSEPGGSRVVPDNAVIVTAGNTDVRYAHIVEFGSTKMQAEPFFWPSYRLSKAKIKRRIKRAISKAVRDGWSK